MGEKGKDHQHAGNVKDLEEDPQRIYYGDIEAVGLRPRERAICGSFRYAPQFIFSAI
ncbi:hypothetical protein ETB97_008301 [Aspergillus alliaceus]|uniref:Uncharacterized protein n=1 Tax=Petromyces alliaceus TaxID=209559 RepID=A0A8H6E2I0_PETAA|nr:hypothetical protein ETB97_008301 [Aspergillus burnettii]